MTLTDSQLAQLSKPQYNAYKYIPTHKTASRFDWSIRRFIWSFKKGEDKAVNRAVKVATKMLQEKFTRTDDVVLVCIPSSSASVNQMRYEQFSKAVCDATGMLNGYEHIKVEGEKLAIHEYGMRKELHDTHVVSFDKEWFNGKQVIIFDDIITRGYNFAVMADRLERFGAEVWGGCFIGRTPLYE